MAEQLRIRRITAYCLLGVCFVTALLIVLNLHTPVRTIAVLLFTGTAPGWALISYVNVRHLSVTWIGAVGLSLSVGLVVSQALVLTHAWHPEAAVLGLVFATAALLAHHVLRSRPRSVP
ncbi:hypothetical protein [Amycolatopsis alkalitolerans]|uniref:Uncharacterized protein n=1 Tax=Amycolatopsis alkalitolerans TaxID=2547244 RepID=A0A5C4M1D4_9PSEU|nr:hypothetical protein [Amycolatopsis alkalitolerans]TNC26462.1 hypothetical protein FG385_11955 [Amycolatopsis alkalitolerans]